MSVTAATDP
uniref:Uncharacterized protein n=1 Tax=Arundo donax TaxID=35708 RepID=A0A0A9BSR6_ARUDO